MRKVVTDVFVASKFMQIKTSAESRGIEFNMSLRRVRQLLSTQRCYFSGVELISNDQKAPNQLTFDRIDNTKGYVDNNVVVCSSKVNLMKGNLTIDNILMLYKGVKKKI